MTVLRLIELSLELVGRLGQGQEADIDDVKDARDIMCSMLSAWNNDYLMIPFITRETFSLPAKQDVTIGPGMDLSTVSPIAIEGVSVVINGINRELFQVSEEYLIETSITPVDVTPHSFSFLPGLITSTILLSSIPPSGGSISVRSLKQLTTLTEMTDETTFPAGYDLAIYYGLAVLLAPIYGKPLNQVTALVASDAYEKIKSKNAHLRPVSVLRMDAGMPGTCSFFSDPIYYY